jgi:hypothetical protein
MRWLYGIGIVEYEAMMVAQDGKCAICKQPPRGNRRLHVDHDHKTNQVRKLLCHYCNGILGHAGDSVEILEAAIAYLRGS